MKPSSFDTAAGTARTVNPSRSSSHQKAPNEREEASASMFAPARSPMEAIMAAMLHMPHAYGGFNIAMQLNRKIDFSEAAQAVSGMPYAVCDAYVPEAHASVEYNGDHHSEGKARIHDERRKLGLAAMGIETFTINFEQLRDVCALESVARTIYRRMGKQYRNRTNASRVKQVTLLNGLRRAFGLNPC